MVILRDYQELDVANIRASFTAGFTAPLYVLPTGGGKTVTYSDIASKVVDRKKKVLITSHRLEIMEQISDTLRWFDVKHGIINPNYRPNPFASVQIGTIQTIAGRLKKMPRDFDLVIIDEAHHATAPSWKRVIAAMHESLVLGVTATPIRTDGKGLGKKDGGMFDTLVMGPQKKRIDRQRIPRKICYLCLPRITGSFGCCNYRRGLQ